LRGHTGALHGGIRFVAGGKILASYEPNKPVKVWDVSAGKELAALPTSEHIWAVAPDGKTLVLRGADGHLRLWDVGTRKERGMLKHKEGAGIYVQFSPDSQVVATATYAGGDTLRFWDVATGGERAPVSSPAGPIDTLAFAPDSKTLATGCIDGSIRLWDVASSGQRPAAANWADDYRAAFLSHDGQTAALISRDEGIQLWDLTTSKMRATLKGHTRPIMAVAFAPDDQTLVTGSSDTTAKIWDVANGQLLSNLNHEGHVFALAFFPDGKRVITGGSKIVKLWDVANGQLRNRLPDCPVDFHSMVLAANGKTMALGGGDPTVRIWEAGSGKERTSFGLKKPAIALAFTPDGQVLAAQAYEERTIKLWDLTANKERATLPTCNVWALAPDSQTVTLGLSTGRLQVYDLANGQMKFPLEGHTKKVLSVAYSADGRLVASSGQDGKLIVWEPAARKRKVYEWQLPGPVIQATFAPDGRHVLTVNGNGSVCLLRLPS
jgi:WD40 repeat protein